MKKMYVRRSPSVKWAAIWLALALLLSALPVAGLAETVPVRFMNEDNTWYSYEVDFDDSVFAQDCGVYQPKLARMSISLAVSAFRDWEQPDRKQHLGEDFLTNAGFTDIRSFDYEGDPTKDTIGMLLARKQLGDRTVVALAVSGEYYRREWVSNLYVGVAGSDPVSRHEGFHQAAEKAFDRLMAYIREHEIGDNWVLWGAGFSRAGAVANITGAMVLRQGVPAPEQVYVYSFGSPAHTRLSEAEQTGGQDRGCWSLLSPYDVIPTLFPSAWEFGRYGHTALLAAPNDWKQLETLGEASARWAREHFRAEWYQNEMSILLREMIDRTLNKLFPTPEVYAESMQETLMTEMNRFDTIGELVISLAERSSKEEEKEAVSETDSENTEDTGWLSGFRLFGNIQSFVEGRLGMSFGEYMAMCFTHGHRPMNYIPALMTMEQVFE